MSSNRKEDYSSKRPQPKTAEQSADEHKSVVANLVLWVTGTITTLFFSMMMSVLIAIVGVTFIWPEEGANHERRTLEIEMAALADELNLVGEGFSRVVDSFTAWLLGAWWGADLMSAITYWFADWVSDEAVMYAQVVYLSMQVFIVRVGVIISSMPMIFAWVLVGFFCGLTERDLRRFNAALESSTIFNLAYSNVRYPFVILLALYLSWPTQAYALFGTIPVSVGSFFMVYFSTANYKKRL